jgi:uncharacterized DUF497 family protein
MSPITFEWDPVKAAANLKKHGVAFDDAATAFQDPLAKLHGDPDHLQREHREILIGHSTQGRLLLVAFTERKSKIRIVSARKVSRRERRAYEESQKHGS